MNKKLLRGKKMKAEKIIFDLVRPLVLSGAYKDEFVAIKDIIVTHIEKK